MLKVGDMFCTKEDYVQAIKNFHMENYADYIIDYTDAERDIILYRNELHMFWLAVNYRKRNGSLEISSIDPLTVALPPIFTRSL